MTCKDLPLTSLHENVVFSVCAHIGSGPYIIFIMWNSICGLEPWYHFGLNISCGVAVTVRSHPKKFQVTFKGMGGGKKNFGGEGQFLRSS